MENNIGLTLGLLNEKNNQLYDLNKEKENKKEEVVVGDAKMLMKM